jgi:hypothetical protein
MLDDPFANLERQIQAGKIQISLFELLDDAQRMKIVIEVVSVFAHADVQLLFAAMPEWRVAHIVDERKRLRKVFVEPKRPRNSARDLRDFDGMRQAVAEVVREARGKDLRLRFQPPEGACVDDAVAVARVGVAVGVRGLEMAAATRVTGVHGIGCEGHSGHSIRWAAFPPRLGHIGFLESFGGQILTVFDCELFLDRRTPRFKLDAFHASKFEDFERS